MQSARLPILVAGIVSLVAAHSQEAPRPEPPAGGRPPGMDGRRGGFGGPMGMAERKIVKDFDKNGDKRLNDEERAEAREAVKKQNAERPRGGFGGPGGFPPPPDGAQPPAQTGQPGQPGQPIPPGPQAAGGPGGRRGGFGPMANLPPATAGIRLTPGDVKEQPLRSLYATNVLPTLFFTFSNKDWEAELTDFHNTDVDVPAKLTIGDETFDEVGLHFRGASSYMMVPQGRKHSLNVSIDHADKKARLDGYKTLNLLNSNGDASMMSTVLYSQIARSYIPAPKANFVRVAINDENWGIYTNVQQFNKDFLQENYRTEKGARWKVKGSPGGGGGLEYLGDKVEDYKRRYELKTDEDVDDWKALIELCRVLKETPAEQLEEKLRPIADVDNLLWFLALDCALINSDGYWVRASDYSLYRDKAGTFRFIPHDMNEAFTIPHMMGGRRGGFGGGPQGPAGTPQPNGAQSGNPQPTQGGNPPPLEAGNTRPPQGGPMPARIEVKGVELDPLVGMDDTSKPLRSKVLAVPSLRQRYLQNVRTIAEEWLDWKKLGPVVAEYRALLEPEIAKETRGLTTLEAFRRATADQAPAADSGDGRRRELSLREFADQRRAYLLAYPAIRDLPR